jgi:2-polyprenyl-3-methyl-5-hydroxy-6-metoxy-1,4-benzoquinol methylase
MFERDRGTYEIRQDAVKRILADEANPLNRISGIIQDGARVIDIGAGNGLLAAVLSESRKGTIIDGIEPDPYAARIAREKYRNFYVGPAQDFLNEIKNGDYDYVVLADVLEHIADPLRFLRSLCECLPESTRIVLSIPNVAFGSVRLAMLNGEFDYVNSGILERSHVRFFTMKTIETLVSNAGLHIEKLLHLRRNIFGTEIPVAELPLGLFCYAKVMRDSLSSVYQFLIVLSKVPCRTETQVYGETIRHPLLSYFFIKLWRSLR